MTLDINDVIVHPVHAHVKVKVTDEVRMCLMAVL